jgi:hypothetical protein
MTQGRMLFGLLSLKADNHPDQISSYKRCDDYPPAPPLSTASYTYGWVCKEFALAREAQQSNSSEEARSSV